LDGKLLPMLTFLAINPVAGWLAALAFAIIAAIAAYSGLSIADCTIIALLLGLGTLGAASLYQTNRSLDAVQQTILCVGIGLILTVMFAQAEDGPWLGSGLLSAPAAAAQHHCHPNHQGTQCPRTNRHFVQVEAKRVILEHLEASHVPRFNAAYFSR
jgi:hypothetical protein